MSVADVVACQAQIKTIVSCEHDHRAHTCVLVEPFLDLGIRLAFSTIPTRCMPSGLPSGINTNPASHRTDPGDKKERLKHMTHTSDGNSLIGDPPEDSLMTDSAWHEETGRGRNLGSQIEHQPMSGHPLAWNLYRDTTGFLFHVRRPLSYFSGLSPR